MLHGRPHTTLLRTLFIVLLAALVAAPAAQAAKGRFGATKKVVVPAKKVRGDVATFKLRKLSARACGAARFRVGKRARKMTARRVRAAVRRRTLRVKLRGTEKRAARRTKPRLVIYRSGRKQPPKRGVVRPTPPPTEEAVQQPPADEQTTVPDSGQPAPAPVESVPAGSKSTFRAAGSAVLSDADAAARVRATGAEKRPANNTANQRVPSSTEIAAFRTANSSLYEPHERLVTGNFRGTTDEIIQWAAWKWGIDEDVFRAQAVTESWWKMSENGDNGESFGIFQIKRTVHLGTYPLSVDSTAFNADYTGALWRYYYDGHATWLMDVEHGKPYSIGDAWGAIGAHYAGRWWANGAAQYVDTVKRHLNERTWAQSWF